MRLTEGIYTISPPYDWAHHRAKWFGLIAEVSLRKPLRDMRILDIGCLEGGITLALGAAGGPVVGIDVREANLAKANFARDVLGLRSVEFVQADMLKLLDYNLGNFDLIVCAGTLYHIDAPALLPFLRTLRQSCSGIVIFDDAFRRRAARGVYRRAEQPSTMAAPSSRLTTTPKISKRKRRICGARWRTT